MKATHASDITNPVVAELLDAARRDTSRQARLLEIEERKLAITEYVATRFGFHIPDDEELDRLFDELAGVAGDKR